MKSLEKYIIEQNYNFDYIDKLIITECNIEYWKNSPVLMYGNLLESLGIFNGCKEITKYIFDKLKENLGDNTIIINFPKNVTNKFFDKCYLHVEYDKKYEAGSGGYISSDGHNDYNEIRYDSDQQIFDFIEINLELDENHINNIYSIIMHELIHAYDDYIHIKKSGFDYSLFNRNKKYDLDVISNNHKKNEDIIIQCCKDIIYHLFKDEQTAYIGQLNGELKDKKYDNIKDIIKDISQTSIYGNYKIIYANYHNIIKSKKYKEQFCDVYRQLNKNNKSNDSIIKELNNKFNKFWSKFINHIYHIATDHVIYEKYATRDSRERIPLLNMSLLEQKGDDIDEQWINDEKPVMTKDGRQVIIVKIDYDKVPNVIKGKVKWNDKLLDYEWNDDGICIKALDRLGNPKKADESDKLVKAQ